MEPHPRYGFHFVDAVDPRCRGAIGIGENGGPRGIQMNPGDSWNSAFSGSMYYVGFSGNMDPKFQIDHWLFFVCLPVFLTCLFASMEVVERI